jgi:hypothetical protein
LLTDGEGIDSESIPSFTEPAAKLWATIFLFEIRRLRLLFEDQVNTVSIRVKVLHSIPYPHKLAATLVVPPAPSHAQLTVFNTPFVKVT